MGFPHIRMRRLRASPALRSMIRETVLDTHDFIMPLFVCSGVSVKQPIKSMPGIFRHSIDLCIEECRELMSVGVTSVILFGIAQEKDATGECGTDDNGIVQHAVQSIKSALPGMLVITDVCNCPYTTHGHCGPVRNGIILNDATLDILARQAVSHAKAGCDMVAPSDMMDGRVGAIRTALDKSGFEHLPVMSYAVKYASAFYGPFREAASSAPQFGDRRTYQMDMANSDEALREAELDLHEGADIIMVKPALSYLDVIHRVKSRFNVPVAAYNVSGEYAMVKAAAQNGWVNEEQITLEILTSIKRAGADVMITYHAKDAATLLLKGQL